MTPAEAVEGSRHDGNFLGMELGFHYESAAVIPDGIGASGAALVRRDGHVAYRAQRPVADPADELSAALARVLGRSPVPSARTRP